MTEDKILDFFGIFPKAEKLVDTFMLKIWVAFNFFTTLFCIGGLFLFQIFDPTPFIITCIIGFSVSFVVLTIWSFFIKNPQQEKQFLTVYFFDMFLKSLYSTVVFSQVENERFTAWYILIAICCLSFIIYNFIYQTKLLKCLQTYDILESHDILEQSVGRLWLKIFGILLLLSAYPALKFLPWYLRIGLGFCSWVFTCGCLTMSICFCSVYFLMRKYNLVEIIKKHRDVII